MTRHSKWKHCVPGALRGLQSKPALQSLLGLMPLETPCARLNYLVSTMSPCLQSPCPLVCGPSFSIIYGGLSQCEWLLSLWMPTLGSSIFFFSRSTNDVTFIRFSFTHYAFTIFLAFFDHIFASIFTLTLSHIHF